MAKGNVVFVRFRDGQTVQTDTFTADKGGRGLSVEVEKDQGVQWLVVTLRTRGGTDLTTARYQLTEVVSYHQSKAETE